jgi:hypothetical protein
MWRQWSQARPEIGYWNKLSSVEQGWVIAGYGIGWRKQGWCKWPLWSMVVIGLSAGERSPDRVEVPEKVSWPNRFRRSTVIKACVGQMRKVWSDRRTAQPQFESSWSPGLARLRSTDSCWWFWLQCCGWTWRRGPAARCSRGIGRDRWWRSRAIVLRRKRKNRNRVVILVRIVKPRQFAGGRWSAMRGEVIPMGVHSHVIEEEWDIYYWSHSGIRSSQKVKICAIIILIIFCSLEWFGTKYYTSEKGFIKCPSAFLSQKMTK